MRIDGNDALEAARATRALREIPSQRRAIEVVDFDRDDVAVRRDSLRISDVDPPCAPARKAASFDRLVEIRRRVLSGAYDRPDVLDLVARKILDRHDV